MKSTVKLGLFALVIGFLSSCTSVNQSMKQANTRVEFNKADFELSGQVTGEATETKVIAIDWERLFNTESGSVGSTSSSLGIDLSSIPVVGGIVSTKAQGYALYELMKANPGYDVVFYPQFETVVERPVIGIGFFTTITKVKVTARLGKLKK